MQSTRTPLIVCAALVVMLGIATGELWYELRSSRQMVVDLQDQLTQAKISAAKSVQVPAPPPPIQAPAAPPVVAQAPPPPPPMIPRALPPRPSIAVPTLTTPLTSNSEVERHADALMQADRAATARVRAWSTVLNLNPEQLQALNETTTAELRRETEESLQIESRAGTMDAQAAARLKVETVTRQHETLVRIVEKMKPQLTPEQSNRMSTMFDAWLTANMARARAEQDRAAMPGN